MHRCATDVANYLGKKYGGWVPTAETYGKSGNKWIDIPICFGGNMPANHCSPALKKAGFSKFHHRRVPGVRQGDQTQQRSGGMALGHATGDGNCWVHWCLWAFGGNLVDAKDKVILNSPETEKALNYAKQLYENMIPGTAAWNDAFNNKAFLAGEVSWTNNGISIYAAAKRDATKKEIAEDMDHALWLSRVTGKPTEFRLLPDPGDDPHQISAGLQGADRLPAGGGSIQQVAGGIGRISDAPSMRMTRTRSGHPIPSTRSSARRPSAR